MLLSHTKFPRGSEIRDYDIFEELPDGSTTWRCCVSGMDSVESKLHELSKLTTNKLFALRLTDPLKQ